MSDLGLARIGQIAVNVTDLEAAVTFYRDTLGMKFLFQFPRLAFFDCAGVRLLLDQLDEWRPSSILYYQVSNIEDAHQSLQARGVAFTDAPHRVAKMPDHDLWMAFFEDPSGNTLALMCEVPHG